jgi:UDP-N-acetylglucosamine--N-acetylmuramyl-(pentapeptide) pyrophosphoryl-undecaprenol N-acetylglucosamine transferase
MVCRLFLVLLVALWKVMRYNPSVVIGTGGAAAFPTCLAAAFSRKPLVLLEPNVLPGAVNRTLVRFARLVFTAFKAPERWIPKEK